MLFKLFKVIDYIANSSTIDVDIFLLQKPRRIPNVFILYILGRQKQSILKSFFFIYYFITYKVKCFNLFNLFEFKLWDPKLHNRKFKNRWWFEFLLIQIIEAWQKKYNRIWSTKRDLKSTSGCIDSMFPIIEIAFIQILSIYRKKTETIRKDFL